MKRTREKHYLLLLTPLLLLVLLLAIYPLLFALGISFFNYRLTDPTQTRHFVGLANYLRAFHSPLVHTAVINTLLFVAGTVSLELLLGLGMALLLNHENKLIQLIRSWLVLPMALPALVVGLIWKALYNVDFGPLTYYLKHLGLNLGRGPLGESHLALPAVMLIDVWQWTPLAMLIFLAGLKSLPQEPYDAARVDGANSWQQFWHLTLPLLKPTWLILLLLRTMQGFKVFDTLYATTGGGPGTATTVLNYHIYTQGMVFFRMGYAAALANILLVLVGMLAIFYIILLERQRR